MSAKRKSSALTEQAWLLLSLLYPDFGFFHSAPSPMTVWLLLKMAPFKRVPSLHTHTPGTGRGNLKGRPACLCYSHWPPCTSSEPLSLWVQHQAGRYINTPQVWFMSQVTDVLRSLFDGQEKPNESVTAATTNGAVHFSRFSSHTSDGDLQPYGRHINLKKEVIWDWGQSFPPRLRSLQMVEGSSSADIKLSCPFVLSPKMSDNIRVLHSCLNMHH